MASEPAVVVTLDGELHDPQAPLLHADDLAAVRGDGVFETLLVRDGRPCLLEAHLAPVDAVRTDDRSARTGPAAVARGGGRAVSSAGPPTAGARACCGWCTAAGGKAARPLRRSRRSATLPARVAAVRRDGVAALTLARGLPADGAADMPWLLAGAKTLSYAVNMAALRHAERHGAGDVIFVSSDGYDPGGSALDGGHRHRVGTAAPCLLTPPPWYPILRGTTQQALFEVARNKGYDCDYRALRPADLVAAQGVWLVSSITLAARVHTLDGKPLRHAPLAAEFAELVDAAIVSDR